MEKLIEKLHAYLQFPEVKKLLASHSGSDGTNPDRHSQHVIEGYKILNDYAYGQDVARLDEAVRLFHRIQTTDMKYLQALALYGTALAHGMADRFKEAQESIAQLRGLSLTIGTDYSDEIEDLKHYASEEMLVDLKQGYERLHPGQELPKPSGCMVLILILGTASLLMFL